MLCFSDECVCTQNKRKVFTHIVRNWAMVAWVIPKTLSSCKSSKIGNWLLHADSLPLLEDWLLHHYISDILLDIRIKMLLMMMLLVVIGNNKFWMEFLKWKENSQDRSSPKNILNLIFQMHCFTSISATGVDSRGIGQKPRPSPRSDQKPGCRWLFLVRLWKAKLVALEK